MFQSETYGILDCLKYDKGLSSDHDDNVWVSTTYINRGEEYSTLTHTNTAVAYILINGDVCIEFDLMTDLGVNAQVGRIATGGTSILGFALANLNLTSNEWHHIKIEINNNTCTISNTENETTITGDVSGFDRFGLRVAGDYHTYFKEVKVYSI